jgi:hypothetical protein
MEFIETPLRDVLNFLQDQHDIPIVLDNGALRESGVDADAPVSANSRDIALRSALNLVLDELGLDYVVDNEVLLVTSAERAARTLDTRVYETRRLGTIPAEQLAEVIAMTVVPNSWRQHGGPGVAKPLPGCLVIHQSQKVHNKIVELLEQLQAHADNPLFACPSRDRQ